MTSGLSAIGKRPNTGFSGYPVCLWYCELEDYFGNIERTYTFILFVKFRFAGETRVNFPVQPGREQHCSIQVDRLGKRPPSYHSHVIKFQVIGHPRSVQDNLKIILLRVLNLWIIQNVIPTISYIPFYFRWLPPPLFWLEDMEPTP